MRSIDSRIQKLESVAKLEALTRRNVMAKPTDPLQVLAWVTQAYAFVVQMAAGSMLL